MARPTRNTRSAKDSLKPEGDQADAPIAGTVEPVPAGEAPVSPATIETAAVSPPDNSAPPAGDNPLASAGAAPSAPANEFVASPTVWVKGPAKGRWRIGRHFTPEPVALLLDDLTEDQAQAIARDPELTVVRVDAPY